MEVNINYPLGIGMNRCANGETVEFFLTLGGRRLSGVGVFRELRVGDSLPHLAAGCLPQLLSSQRLP